MIKCSAFAANGKTYYVSPKGQDRNNGSIDKPFHTLGKAWAMVKAGDTIFLRGGVYRKENDTWASVRLKDKKGKPDSYIKIWAYKNETPVFDFSDVKPHDNQSGIGMSNVNYVHIKGLELKNLQGKTSIEKYNVFTLLMEDCCNNIIENVSAHDNQGVGIMVRGKSGGNRIVNCDGYRNYDPHSGKGRRKDGGNADGIQLAFIPRGQETNYVIGCRMWENSDDGLDLFHNESQCVVANSWTFKNGYRPGTEFPVGDGNGFKLGDSDDWNKEELLFRKVHNCVAYNNRKKGFDENDAMGKMLIINNTSVGNGMNQYSFFKSQNLTLRNNIAMGKNITYLRNISINDHNSWTIGKIEAIAKPSDFISVDPKGIRGPRQADGSLPALDFLKLAPKSKFIDKGIDVGLPFSGSAPDLGAYERN